MLTFNEKLKEIRIWEVLIVYVVSLIIFMMLDISETMAFAVTVIYILIRTRHQFDSLKDDLTHISSKIPLKTLLLIFITNLIFAIGVGYFTEYLLGMYPWLDYLPGEEDIIPGLTVTFLIFIIETVLIAPISEEFLFRGVLLSRLNR